MLHVTLRCPTWKESDPYQKDVFKDLRRTVHLAQDDNHLIVYELLELSQVAGHVHFQLSSDLCVTAKIFQKKKKNTRKLQAPEMPDWKLQYLFAGDILQVFLHHDLPQTGFDLSLRQLSFCWTAEQPRKQNFRHYFHSSKCWRRAELGYLHIREEQGRIGAVRLHVLHGVPLVDAYLVGGNPALIVADPGKEQAAWEVVVTAGHFTCFVQ